MGLLYFLLVCVACAVTIFLVGLFFFFAPFDPWISEILRLLKEVDDDIEVLLGRKTREAVYRQEEPNLLLSPVPLPPAKPLPSPGEIGTTVTPLRPWGKLRIGNVCYDAKAAIGYLDAGIEVRVIEQTAAGVVVDAIDLSKPDSTESG